MAVLGRDRPWRTTRRLLGRRGPPGGGPAGARRARMPRTARQAGTPGQGPGGADGGRGPGTKRRRPGAAASRPDRFGQRHPDALAVGQQRQRVEVQGRVVAGPCPASRTLYAGRAGRAGQHLAVERPVGQRATRRPRTRPGRRTACRAPSRPARVTPVGGRGDRPGARRPDAGQGHPAAPRSGRSRRAPATGPGRSAAAAAGGGGSVMPSTTTSADLRRGVLDRALDGQLDGDRRRRAAVAAALQPQPGHAVADAEVLHPARVRAEVGPDLVERPLDPLVHV